MSGRVNLSWELGAGRLELRWAENGGPPAQAPTSPGFGTRIITASIEGQLGGKSAFEWRPEGLQCVLSVPREDLAPAGKRPTAQSADSVPDGRPLKQIAVAGNR